MFRDIDLEDSTFIYIFLHELKHAYSYNQKTYSHVPNIFLKQILDLTKERDNEEKYRRLQLCCDVSSIFNIHELYYKRVLITLFLCYYIIVKI